MIVHQFWHDEDAPFPALREWMRFDYDTVLWTPDTVPGELATLLKLIDGTCRPADWHRHQANLVRYWVLHRYGGVWLDVDVVPIDPLDDFPFPYVAAHGTPCTCVMAFPERHPMLKAAMNEILGLPLDETPACVEVSGDHLLARVITPDVILRPLPFDAAGVPLPDGEPWAIHLYTTSSKAGVP